MKYMMKQEIRRCYWCGGLMSEADGVTRKVSSTFLWWHKKCAVVDPLYPVKPEPVMDRGSRDGYLDE